MEGGTFDWFLDEVVVCFNHDLPLFPIHTVLNCAVDMKDE